MTNYLKDMSIDEASMILRRKPQNLAEMNVARVALKLLQRLGMDQEEIEVEIRRSLSFGEELVLAEF